MSKWLAQETEDHVVHVVPLDDIVEHVYSDECACGPHLTIDTTEDTPDGHTYTHHSLDGREANE